MSDSIFNEISKQTINRYSARLAKHGKDIKTLGWGSIEQQEYRFSHILQSEDFTGKRVLDIGCGFGDLFDFIAKVKINIESYTGWDLNDSLLKEANNRDNALVRYNLVDISKDLAFHSNEFDIGIMLGLLNYNLKSEELNYDYSKKLINNAFTTTKDLLVVDFLSTNRSPDYPKEDFVFYHDPAKMLEFALRLTPNVVLKHNYMPIPQKEFMLFLYKS